LFADERKHVLDHLADAHKARIAMSSGIYRLEADKVISDERATSIGYHKCFDARQSKHSTLKKRSAAEKLIATTKWTARETVLRDQLKSTTLDHKYCREKAKIFNNQLRKRDKDLAKTSGLLVNSQRKLSDVNSTLTEVIHDCESFKKLNNTLEPEATRLGWRAHGQAEQPEEDAFKRNVAASCLEAAISTRDPSQKEGSFQRKATACALQKFD
jgi:hypothetical protein